MHYDLRHPKLPFQGEVSKVIAITQGIAIGLIPIAIGIALSGRF